MYLFLGYAGLYAQGASSRHMAASSQPTGVSGGFDRSMSILQQTAPQQYQQQHHVIIEMLAYFYLV